MLPTSFDFAAIAFGPSEPASIPGVPVISDGEDPTILIGCQLTGDAGGDSPDVVATLNGNGIVATESHTLTGVKALFE